MDPAALTSSPAGSLDRGRLAGWGVLAGLAAVEVALVALPYLPGGYDAAAAPVSAAIQLFGFTGLAPAALGVAWLALRKVVADPSRDRTAPKFDNRMAITAIAVAAAAIIAAGSMFAAHGSPITWLGLTVACIVAGGVLVRRVRRAGVPWTGAARRVPAYLIVMPLVAFTARTLLVPRLGELSRARAMDNAAVLVAAIEQYREQHGHYPAALASVHTDFRPGVRGVARYGYAPDGSTYDLYFEHLADAFDTREIIVYNPTGSPRMTSHDSDLLEFAGEDLERRRGYYAVLDTPRSNWKRFLFD